MSRTIHQRSTLLAYLNWAIYVVLGIFIVSSFMYSASGVEARGESFSKIWIIESAIAVLILLGLWDLTWLRVRSRQSDFEEYCRIQGFDIEPSSGVTFSNCSINNLSSRATQIKNCINQPGWAYAELTIPRYTSTKFGDYKSSEIYYSMMAVDLPRALPNMFFDSKKARGRQFKYQFDKNQQHSMEGNFDHYFATYFPSSYSIDGLSIITPEVMEVLIQGADYDIEIVGSKLYLYGALLSPDELLPDMYEKSTNIKQKLLNNILTYRDDRLPAQVGRERVAEEGMYLKKPGINWKLGIVCLIGYVVLTWFIHR